MGSIFIFRPVFVIVTDQVTFVPEWPNKEFVSFIGYIQSLFLQLGKRLNMTISLSQASRRQFLESRKILLSLQLSIVSSLVAVRMA
jgi:hypothetical protein